MKVHLIEHENEEENGRIEILFSNYPYIDGNDLLVKIIEKLYGATQKEKQDGMYYSITKIQINNCEYVFVWHEDFGNYGYCVPQTKANNEQFKLHLKTAFEKCGAILP